MRDLQRELADILAKHRNMNLPWPEKFPADIGAAVKFWIKIQGPAKRSEASRKQYSKIKGEAFWVFPYIDRVTGLLKSFLSQSDYFQDIILSAHEDNISWRGDEEDNFMIVISESLKQQEMGKEAFRKYAIGKYRNFDMGKAA